jgi:hypothetical protein
MSNHLFVAAGMYLINRIMFINKLMTLLYINSCIAIFVWLISGLPCLKFN